MKGQNVIYKVSDGLEVDCAGTLAMSNGYATEIIEGYGQRNQDGSITFYPSGIFFKK